MQKCVIFIEKSPSAGFPHPETRHDPPQPPLRIPGHVIVCLHS